VQCQICADCELYLVTSTKFETSQQYYYRLDTRDGTPIEVHSRPAFYRGINASVDIPHPEMIVLLHTGNRYAFWNITDQLTPANGTETRDQILQILSKYHSQWVLSADTVPFRSTATAQIFPFNLTWTDRRMENMEIMFTCVSSEDSCSKSLL